MSNLFTKISSTLADRGLNLVFFVALIATIGSLFLSTVVELLPCDLCWWQRIFMYPIVIVSGLGLFWEHKFAIRYVLALSIPGFAIAFYHFLLQTTDIEQLFAPGCSVYVSCGTIDVALAGFITIPMMSMVAFAVITALAAIKLTAHK